jgi:hypothetical protein
LIKYFAALLIAFTALAGKPETYPTYVLSPVDQASLEKSFVKFRTRLIQAVEDKDAAFLMATLNQNIAFSFGLHGYGDGPAGFKRMWKLDKHPEKSKLWPILLGVLNNGGAFSKDHSSFEAPYVVATWPGKYNSYDFIAVNAEGVSIREKPSQDSPLLQKISYEIVRLVSRGKGKPEAFAEIKLPDGHRGYIQNRFLESSVGYRARFEWTGKEWKIATFILGE